MLDFNSRSALTDRLNFLIDQAIDAVVEEPRQYLGASIIGHSCERHVQFHLLAARGEVTRQPMNARVKRIFDRGNLYEDRVRKWLKDAGFLFGTTKKGKAFSDFGGQFKGHVDGVITGWKQKGAPCPVDLPLLWENKCLGSKGWKKVADEKLKKYSGTYFAQVQLYMYYLGLERAIFTAINADTMEIYHELVPLDQMEADLYRSRVAAVITASDEGYLLGRISKDPAYYICKMCDFRGACHAN